jgi:anaerobic ribonucleoside-triphosphate reductase activating protein
MTRIAVNKAHFPVTVLGPGRRIGIWLQGCSIGCPGCVSRDTWDADPGRLMPVDALLEWCRNVGAGGFDGVTISGGEPFDQPAALEALLGGLQHWRDGDGLDFDILCYSGHPLRLLERRHGALLARLDGVIPEPYVESLPTEAPWRGSANQPLIALSERGRRRYEGAGQGSRALQARVDRDRIWYIGIPRRGDMDRIETLCRERGLDFKSVSWRS